MSRIYKILSVILLTIIIAAPCSSAKSMERAALREQYRVIFRQKEGEIYTRKPLAAAPYEEGEVCFAALQEALNTANFIRALSGLKPLELDETLTLQAQRCAVLLAANQALSHQPKQPDDMEEGFYQEGALAAACCNLAMFNWEADDLLCKAVLQFASDDGESNLALLGHRRWLLYPGMRKTGFGLAEDKEGRSYAAMYVMDASGEKDSYEMICWPSGGLFPAEFMRAETAWSISFSPRRYDLNRSDPVIGMTEENSGASFLFDGFQEDASLSNYLALGGGRYGDGPAYIFRPDLSQYDELMYGYQQNQVWTVTVSGLIHADGSAAETVSYRVEMVSLTPQDPAGIEVEPRVLMLHPGESERLTAQVIPDWADDLTVKWHSEDETVATVEADGTVLANASGVTGIVAESVNGRSDRVEVAVSEK